MGHLNSDYTDFEGSRKKRLTGVHERSLSPTFQEDREQPEASAWLANTDTSLSIIQPAFGSFQSVRALFAAEFRSTTTTTN